MEIFVYRDWNGSKQKVGTHVRQEGMGSERFRYSSEFLQSGTLGISERIPAADVCIHDR